jgi:hypothetical protein
VASKARSRLDVLDAGRPGGVIGHIVLDAERLEHKQLAAEPGRDGETFRN